MYITGARIAVAVIEVCKICLPYIKYDIGFIIFILDGRTAPRTAATDTFRWGSGETSLG